MSRSLTAVVTLLCAFNLCSYLLIDPRQPAQLAVATGIVAVSFAVIWRFARGANWARVLVLITGVIALLNLFTLGYASVVQRIVIIAEAAFAVFLFYWLFTAPVRQFFASGRDSNIA